MLLVFATVASALQYQPANALTTQITDRSLKLVAGATDGGSKPGGTVNDLFTFTVNSGGSVGSIKFEYCTTASVTACSSSAATTGDASGATLSSQTGATGFTLSSATTNTVIIARASASPITTGTVLTYQLDGIVNPSNAAATTFFVRITTFTGLDGATTEIDGGTVAASTAEQIFLSGTMPESLIFCAGGTISKTAGIPDCTTATSGAVTFDQLFSPTDTATASSQMAASTNANSGYAITVNGLTLYSGGTPITAMATAGPGVRGTAQFGMNLKLNTTATSTVAVGAEIDSTSDGVDLTGQATPASGYDVVDNFKFVSGNTVADSGQGGSPGPTNSQIYTVSYIVNVPGNQPAGLYTTTLTYICTSTF